MFNILVDFPLTKKINIEKLGITFRNFTKKEKNTILEFIDNIYLKNKKIIQDAIKKYDIKDELKLSIDLLKYDKLSQEVIMFCFMSKKRGFTLNSIRKIKKLLDNMIIIDINKDILSEYLAEEKYVIFISNILSLYDIYSSDIHFNKNVKLDYSFILNRNILNKKDTDYELNLIINLIMSLDQKMAAMIELSEDYLLCLKKFFSKLNKNEIRRFLNVIDLFYSDNMMIQNKILNDVTLAESVLIKEGEDIKSNYILKSGLILKHYAKGGESINKFIRDFLNYCYDIRSAIVHGNEEKILEIYNKAMQKNKSFKELARDIEESYNNKKMKALSLANTMCFIVNRAIIKYWLENPSIVSYLKN